MNPKRWLARTIKSILLWFLSPSSPVGKVIARESENFQRQQILRGLESYGERVQIQMPVVISDAQNVCLGNDVSLAAFVHIWGLGHVSIADRVMIGTHTSISSQTHDYTAKTMYNTSILAPVFIEEDVWIGSNCVILPGIRVGKGAVVGAGAVVTHDVQPGAIVTGVPAKVLKYRPGVHV